MLIQTEHKTHSNVRVQTTDINFLQEAALFVKEKADIERDYAKRLDGLSKKFQTRKLKTLEKIRKQAVAEEDAPFDAMDP